MIVHLYARAWNEERMLPFFLRHYVPLVDRIFIFDGGSTDRTTELLAECPIATVEPLEIGPDQLRMDFITRHENQIWKQSRGVADWVIVADIDELLYHPHFRPHLEDCTQRGLTLLPSTGYEMIGKTFPSASDSLPQTYRHGVPSGLFSKTIVFDPNALEDTHFGHGRHIIQPTGRVIRPDTPDLLLLHYKHLGYDYFSSRQQELSTRPDPRDLARGLNTHYFLDEEKRHTAFQILLAQAVLVPGLE